MAVKAEYISEPPPYQKSLKWAHPRRSVLKQNQARPEERHAVQGRIKLSTNGETAIVELADNTQLKDLWSHKPHRCQLKITTVPTN